MTKRLRLAVKGSNDGAVRSRRDGRGHPLTLLIGLILGASLTILVMWFYSDHVLLHRIDDYLIMMSQGSK